VSNLVDSGSVIIAAFTLVGGAVGFVVGAFLSDWLAKRREGSGKQTKVHGRNVRTIQIEAKRILTVTDDDEEYDYTKHGATNLVAQVTDE
jgi:hypothetical protein